MPVREAKPFREALASQLGRVLLPTAEGSAAIAKLPAEIRERARFSARTTDLGYLAEMDRLLTTYVSPVTAGAEAIDPATVRWKLKEDLVRRGYIPPEGREGGIQDLSSDARLNLIVRTSGEMAYGYGQHLKQQDRDMLDLYPCLELYRLESRREPRDWLSRWRSAGGSLYAGRMVARKDDVIWKRISHFSLPYPPFDYNSGMWTRNVSRAEAERLGVIARATIVTPQVRPINEAVETRMPRRVSPALMEAVLSAFAGRMVVEGERIILKEVTG